MSAPFYIVGPTAVGKSRLAVEVAARCGAEIVGADAFQLYAGFDLLTAKPSLADRQRVPHHLIGTVSPSETYNVARYLDDARRSLDEIAGRGKPVIVVGGTGLYVKALTHGLSPLPEADAALRAELESLDAPTLLARLHLLDPLAADHVDRHNKRRLVRALEVCLLTGRPFSSQQSLWTQTQPAGVCNGVFLTRTKPDLQARIATRIAAMFDQGVVEEVRTAPLATLSPTASRMIGLPDIENYLAHRQTLARCQENIRVATRQYAKRQVTWFQRETSFEPVDLTALASEQAQTALLVERFLAFTRRAEIG